MLNSFLVFRQFIKIFKNLSKILSNFLEHVLYESKKNFEISILILQKSSLTKTKATFCSFQRLKIGQNWLVQAFLDILRQFLGNFRQIFRLFFGQFLANTDYFGHFRELPDILQRFFGTLQTFFRDFCSFSATLGPLVVKSR